MGRIFIQDYLGVKIKLCYTEQNGEFMVLIFQKATMKDLPAILQLYKKVIQTTFTTWNENYPSEDLILNDIKNSNLFVLKNSKNDCIAVSFLGINDDSEENWSIQLKRPQGVARICVDSDYQGKGIGSYFMRKLIDEAKMRGADGMHFHVCTENISAMKMYEKVGFKNYGPGKSNYGFDYYKYEQGF